MKIFYNVRDGGDGSSYPTFFATEKMAEIDSKMQSEVYDRGFAEECIGEIEFTGEIISSIVEEDEFLTDLYQTIEDYPDKRDLIMSFIECIIMGED